MCVENLRASQTAGLVVAVPANMTHHCAHAGTLAMEVPGTMLLVLRRLPCMSLANPHGDYWHLALPSTLSATWLRPSPQQQSDDI